MPRSSIKMLGKPAIGEIHVLHAGQELDNAVDKFARKVVQNNETVGHLPCEYSRILWLSCRKNYCKRLCVGMEIPCGWCSVARVKWKLVVWNNCWRARFANKHATQTSSLARSHHSWKSRWTSATREVPFMCILDILRSFMNIIRFLRTPNTDVSVDKPHSWFLASSLWKEVRLIHGRLR